MNAKLLLAGALGSVLAAWLALLWLPAPGFDLPWSSPNEHPHEPATFALRAGSGSPVADGFRLSGADPGGRTLLMHPWPELDATAVRYLRFKFDRLPPTLRPLLVWRGPDGDGSAAVPWTRTGGTIDLQQITGWPARIDAIGLLLMPMDAVPLAAADQRDLTFEGLQLSGPNRRSAAAALWTEWFAYRPWTGRSINTGGFELPIERSVRPLTWLAISVAGGLLATVLVAGRRRRWRPLVFGAVILLWVLLDLLQLRQLGLRAEAARQVRAATPAGAPITAQLGLSEPMVELHHRLADLPAGTRLLVFGEGPFLRQYPVFLLRGFDVAPLPSPAHLPTALGTRPVLVLVGPGDWRFDASRGRLSFGGRELAAEVVLERPPLAAYRLGAGP